MRYLHIDDVITGEPDKRLAADARDDRTVHDRDVLDDPAVAQLERGNMKIVTGLRSIQQALAQVFR